jgi:hypothetical protein
MSYEGNGTSCIGGKGCGVQAAPSNRLSLLKNIVNNRRIAID